MSHDQSLDLVEHRRVGQVEVVPAVDRADGHEPDRRIVPLHLPDLHRGGVGAEQRQRLRRVRRAAARRRIVGRRRQRLGEVERVLHVPRRMLGRHVERFEVVVVVLDLGPLEHLIAETRGRWRSPRRE